MMLKIYFVLFLAFLVTIVSSKNQCCPENEVYKECGSACPKTCAADSEDTICTEQCVVGCFCKDGYVRNSADKCILPSDC
ncbi:hypothetical protein K1T71_009573 [Dendrolimus kikuchii]|uniref:Uncharacterized protein n=1 Tax=Dendrolimus kikuchii TaxID=765133 RepID=A0ACC1CS83_9NEOP|nr:hypothetical protein K1T71_009573 [Dendrolimus kikuchii]